MDLTLKTNFGFILTAAIFIAALLLAYYYYKKTKAEGLNRKVFTLLRFLSILFILLLFSSPVISFFKNTFQDPVNVYLIDNSQSLLIENRTELLKNTLKNDLKDPGSGNSENLYFLFSGNLMKELGSDELENVSYDGIDNFETDLTGTFYSLNDRLVNKNLSSITVISDGILNEGGNPLTAARTLNAPVNYFLTGDTLQKKDLVIKNLYFNKTAFIESNVPVIAEINAYGYDRSVNVNLYENDNLILTKELLVNSNQNLYSLTFNISSNTEAVIKYKIEIEPLEDEITKKNNFNEFFIKYLNNKFKVLVIAGGPSPDLGYVSEELKRIRNFETTFLTQKSADSYYEDIVPDLNEFDTFILLGYPTALSDLNLLSEINSSIEKNNSSLVFISGRNIDYTKLSVLYDHLPFKATLPSDNESVTGIRTVDIRDNQVFKNEGLINSINSYPDIFKTSTEYSINPSAETFMVMTAGSVPALVLQNTDKNRSAAFLAYGLYKWRLNGRTNNSDEVLSYLLSDLIISLTDRKENKMFSIETSRQVYSKYENVKFQSRLLNYDIIGGEYIKVQITGENFREELVLTKKDNNYFEGEINIQQDGIFEYTAELISQDNAAASITNKFLIGENNYEYKITRADNSYLSELSNNTGGSNFTGKGGSEISDLLKEINANSGTEIKTAGNFELNFNPYYLGIVIFLLCLEWFLRKRNSLP